MLQLPKHPLRIPSNQLREECCRSLRRIGYLFLGSMLLISAIATHLAWTQPLPATSAPAKSGGLLHVWFIMAAPMVFVVGAALLCSRGIGRRSKFWLG